MALYHKHRPQTFASVIGQEHIVATLENQVAGGKVAHAYLFSGPRGVGKTTLARIIAKAVNCQKRKDGKGEPCDECTACTEITAGRSIDVIEIDAASHTGVDNVRENIIENAQFKPTSSPFKVFIIDEVHMLSTSAFNALLKTLEEPPTHVIFILATTERHKLPETIISRCQRFEFHHIPFDDMVKHLKAVAKEEGVTVDADVLERIAGKSEGCARDGISLLDQLMATGEKKITADVASVLLPLGNNEQLLSFVTACVKKDMAAGLLEITNIADAGGNMHQFATACLDLFRALLLINAGGKLPEYGFDMSTGTKAALETLAKEISADDIIRLVDLLLMRRSEIKTAPIPALPMELFVIEWCTNGGRRTPAPIPAANIVPTAAPISRPPAPATFTAPVTPTEPTPPPQSKAAMEITKAIELEAPPVSTGAAFELSQVTAIWPTFLSKMEQKSPSLVFILKLADVAGVSGNSISLKVQFGLHRDRIMDLASRRSIEDLLTSLIGSQAHIDVSVKEKEAEPEPSPELQELAALMGGEVVQ